MKYSIEFKPQALKDAKSKDFLRTQEEIEAYEDLRALREGKEREKNAATIPLERAKDILGL